MILIIDLGHLYLVVLWIVSLFQIEVEIQFNLMVSVAVGRKGRLGPLRTGPHFWCSMVSSIVLNSAH